MIKIAITGGIASGKSLVEEIFRQHGAVTLDTDEVAHDLLAHNTNVIRKIRELFAPADVTKESEAIDRKKVGEIVFADKKKLEQLENIIHPEVKQTVNRFFSDNKHKKITVVSVPQLYESGMETMFDYVVLVVADEEIRLKRLMESRNYSRETALTRIRSQKVGEEKLKKADFVIENNNSTEKLRSDVESIVNKLCTKQ